MEQVILVDAQDREIGLMEKMEAHRRGLMHRAVSVFVFNDREELLLQQRAVNKYHSAQKWSNTCCTHPSPGEIPLIAAQRRLGEEMGLTVPLTEVFTFSYHADTGNGFIENEFDHVFFGLSSQSPEPDPNEVSDWKWITMEALKYGLIRNHEEYSPWLLQCFDKVFKHKSEWSVN